MECFLLPTSFVSRLERIRQNAIYYAVTEPSYSSTKAFQNRKQKELIEKMTKRSREDRKREKINKEKQM